MARSVLSVANTFLELARQEGVAISNMKLQKLLYFAQGHSLGLLGRPVMDELPEAWKFGPVFPSAYHEFKQFGADDITRPACEFDPNSGRFYFVPPLPEGPDRDMVIAVWNAYKQRSPLQLVEMSHTPGGPWDQAYGNGVFRNADISADSMKTFFSTRPR